MLINIMMLFGASGFGRLAKWHKLRFDANEISGLRPQASTPRR
jgi:hypothetical protein